jgi:nucleotide-binding universal stress UspA family protein
VDTKVAQMNEFVIGVDGSDDSRLALKWGTSMARRAGLPARVLQAWSYPTLATVMPIMPSLESRDEMDAKTVSDVHAIVEETLGEVSPFVHVDALRGPPAQAILETLTPDSVLCLGSRGLGGFKGMLLGSVSRTSIEYATCPVVITRGSDPDDGNGLVLVGMDGSEGSIVARDWALSIGELTGARVAAVHAWQPSSEGSPKIRERVQTSARKALEGWVRDGDAEPIDVEGDPRQELVDLADRLHATLIVVGRRGTSRLMGIATGGVTSYLVANSPTSIAVVPPPDSSGDA